MHWTFLVMSLLLAEEPAEPPQIGPVPEPLRKEWRLSPFYKRHVDLQGFPLLSSDKVSDAALQEAAYLIEQMLAGRDDVRKALIRAKVRFAVMAPTEMTTDVPEHSDLTPKDYWDHRARGLGATRARPAVSCGEENLLNLRGDRYPRENILIHEFAHAIHEMGLRRVDERFDCRLRKCFDDAMAKGLWKGTYAATNYKEYWAEAVQSYFDCNNPRDRQHNEASTREKLAKFDPDVFALIDETFKSTPWRYVRYDRRKKP
jgi:alpha-glucosidase